MEQCTNSAVDVVEDKSLLLAVCTSCRLKLGAVTPEEKRETVRQFDARQRALFSSDR